MAQTEAIQVAAAVLMLNAAYLTYVCPCNKLLSCHKMAWGASVGGAAVLIYYDNYF
jgi:hypothetical protein